MEVSEQIDVIVPVLGALVKGVRPDQLDDPTPCVNFRVRDLMGHFLGNLDSVAGGLRGEPMPDELAPRPEILGDDPGKAYDAVMADFRDAIRTPGAMDRVLKVPFGEVPAPALVGFVAFDLIVHSWDIATATGQQYTPPDELVAEVEPPADATPLERLVAFSGRHP